MFFLYQLILTIIILISPALIVFRILKNKEHRYRYKEKFGFYSKRRVDGKLIWFHGASVGEILSIIPLVKNYEKDKNINQILITSSTLSSSKIIKKFKFKKTIHQFYPLDHIFITQKFLKYWKPNVSIYTESEVWPSMFNELDRKKIPLILINSRITKKSFGRWQIFSNFANQVFGKISLALPQNQETLKYLKSLKVKNIKIAGNLKYYGQENNKDQVTKSLKNKFKNFKVWCAASTHGDEEILIGKLHKRLKNREKKIITIIIPRHVNRTNSIIDTLNNLNLNCVKHSSNRKLKKNTDIYLVDSYGESSRFYSLTNICFVGGSIVKHGGQNPLEPARLGNYIINGPNVKNFKEIYTFLNSLKISSSTSNILKMEKKILRILKTKNNNRNIKKIIKIGNDVLKKNLLYINRYLI
jgi:3-deoxy-D-manno-octulosonic-acid transferase